VTDYIRPSRSADTVLAPRELVEDLNHEVALYKEFKQFAQDQANVRNDMYVASEAISLMQKSDASLVKAGKQPVFSKDENAPGQLQER